MKISIRGWIVIGAFSAVVVLVAFAPWLSAADAPALKPGQLSEQSLGKLLQAMGLEPKKSESRYDFTFKAIHNKEDWNLSMSAVLSQDGESLWVMAWLDELPRSARDVPRTALLRLLSNNDRLGNGKFFAYVASNRRFVMQRIVANQNMSTAAFRNVLKDLGISVVQTYPHWAITNWKSSKTPVASDSKSNAGAAKPTQSANSKTKFLPPTRR